MPNVLIVAYYFPPLGGGGTQRTLKFVRYLPEFGWKPHLLTVRDSHHLMHDDSLLPEVPEELAITRTPAILPARFFRKALRHRAGMPRSGNTRSRRLLAGVKNLVFTCAFIPDEYVGWLPFAARAGKRIVQQNKIDVIYSSGPPNTAHVIAQRLSHHTGLPWAADLRDLWDQYPESYNPWNLRWRAKLDDDLEKKVLRQAQHIIVVSDEMRQHLLKKISGLAPESVHVITNGFDPADFEKTLTTPCSDRFTLVHSGTLFPWRSIQPFLFVMQRLGAKMPLRLKLLGVIPQADRRAIQDSGLSQHIEVFEYLPYRESLRHLVEADVLLLLVGNLPHAANMLTSKLFDYIGAQRPILALGPPGMARTLIEHENLGCAFAEDDTEAIAAMLQNWIAQKANGGIAFDARPHTKYQRRQLTATLAKILAACLSDA